MFFFLDFYFSSIGDGVYGIAVIRSTCPPKHNIKTVVCLSTSYVVIFIEIFSREIAKESSINHIS